MMQYCETADNQCRLTNDCRISINVQATYIHFVLCYS